MGPPEKNGANVAPVGASLGLRLASVQPVHDTQPGLLRQMKKVTQPLRAAGVGAQTLSLEP